LYESQSKDSRRVTSVSRQPLDDQKIIHDGALKTPVHQLWWSCSSGDDDDERMCAHLARFQ
jgi:hypothetical protein